MLEVPFTNVNTINSSGVCESDSRRKLFGIDWRSFLPVLLAFVSFVLPVQYAASLFLILSFSLFAILKYSNVDTRLRDLILLSLMIRTIIIVVDELAGIMPPQSDSFIYHWQAQKIMENFSNNSPLFYEVIGDAAVKSYSLFLSIIYSVFGDFMIVARFVNSILGIMVAVTVYKICQEIFRHERIAILASAFTLFLPSFIAFTSYALRDPLVLLLTLSMLYRIILIGKKKRAFSNSLVAIIDFALIGILRNQNFYLYFAMFSIYLGYVALRSGMNKWIKFLLLATPIAIATTFYLSRPYLVVGILTYPFRAQPLRAEGGSAYLLDVQYHSIWDLIRYLPIRFVYFTFGPFIWNANSPFLFFSALEGILIVIAAYYTIKYFATARIHANPSLQALLLLFCILGLLANSMVDSNFGTAVRHKINYVLFYFVFASAYFRQTKLRLI